jgi:MurNAc alpha-1-phosphate uridylyltransferase
MKAMIMAAGKGTRLGRITGSLPKVLVDINGKSVLHLAVEKCTLYGFDDIIVNVHHFAEMVIAEARKLKGLGYRITISDETDRLLETGGGLYKARNFFDSSPFLLYNADIVTDIDLADLYRFHREKKGLATLAVRNRPGNRYFLVNNEGLISGWCNKATGEKIITGTPEDELHEIAFSGIHIIEPDIFNYMEEGIFTMTSLYLRLASLHKIYTFRYDEGYWFDMGTPESLEAVRKMSGCL